MAATAADPCALLTWDTQFWGIPIAQVQPDLLTVEQLGNVETWCQSRGVRCLYYLARADDATTNALVQSAGFRFVDARVTFSRSATDGLGASAGRSGLPADTIVRPSRPEDLDRLRQIAREAHRDSRFYFDQAFPRPKCDALYETWITRSCEGWADRVHVALLAGEPVGYLSCHVDAEVHTGRIGLFAVDRRAHGLGIGRELILEALKWFAVVGASPVFVATQARNVAAQRFYQRSGFVTEAVQLWYHKWYAARGGPVG